jgi:hypothetical protein
MSVPSRGPRAIAYTFETVEEAADNRAFRCLSYDDCLDLAASLAWASFTCRQCPACPRLPEPTESSLELVPLDRTLYKVG